MHQSIHLLNATAPSAVLHVRKHEAVALRRNEFELLPRTSFLVSELHPRKIYNGLLITSTGDRRHIVHPGMVITPSTFCLQQGEYSSILSSLLCIVFVKDSVTRHLDLCCFGFTIYIACVL